MSVIALGGSFLGWNLWFVAGGWHRSDHLWEGALWGVSAVTGLWTAVDAIRFDKGTSAVTVLAGLLCIFHTLSILLLWMFVKMLALGGPRP